MSQTTEVEVYIIVDTNGDQVCGLTPGAAREAYATDIGPLDQCDGFRMVKVIVNVPTPTVADLKATAPEYPDPTA